MSKSVGLWQRIGLRAEAARGGSAPRQQIRPDRSFWTDSWTKISNLAGG